MITDKHELKRFLLKRGMGLINSGTHRPIPNLRQRLTMKMRGGDSRSILLNRVSQIRKLRDNDAIIQNRPLG